MYYVRLSLIALALLAACSKPGTPADEAAPESTPAPPMTPPAVITAPEEPSQPMPMTLVYQCENAARITIANLDDQGARIAITLPGETAVELPQAESASGVKYDNGTLTFIGKGDEALIERGGKALYSQCKLQSAG